MARLTGYGGSVVRQDGILLFNCDVAWDTTTGGSITSTLDNVDYVEGTGSSKIVIGAAHPAYWPMVGLYPFTAIDISSYDHLSAWVKCTATQLVNTFLVSVDNHNPPATSEANYSIPAITSADTWTLFELPLYAGDWATATAVIAIEMNTELYDPGACTLHMDSIYAGDQPTAVAGIRSWQINENVRVQEDTSFIDGVNEHYRATTRGWAGSFEGFKDGAPLDIGDEVYLYLKESDTTGQLWSGTAIIMDRGAATSVNGLVMYSYSFRGIGAVTPPTA